MPESNARPGIQETYSQASVGYSWMPAFAGMMKLHPAIGRLLQHKPLIPFHHSVLTFFAIRRCITGIEHNRAFFSWDILSHKPGIRVVETRTTCTFIHVIHPLFLCLRCGRDPRELPLSHITNTVSAPCDDHLSTDSVVAQCGVRGNEEVREPCRL